MLSNLEMNEGNALLANSNLLPLSICSGCWIHNGAKHIAAMHYFWRKIYCSIFAKIAAKLHFLWNADCCCEKVGFAIYLAAHPAVTSHYALHSTLLSLYCVCTQCCKQKLDTDDPVHYIRTYALRASGSVCDRWCSLQCAVCDCRLFPGVNTATLRE